MARGNESTALLRVEIDRAARIEQTQQLSPGASRTAARYDERTSGAPQNLRGLGDPSRIGLQKTGSTWLHPFVEDEILRHLRPQHVSRDFQIHRPRLAEIADDPAVSLIQDQVEMGVAARMAILASLSARLDNH